MGPEGQCSRADPGLCPGSVSSLPLYLPPPFPPCNNPLLSTYYVLGTMLGAGTEQ